MSEEISQAHLKSLLVGYLAVAKSELNDEQFASVQTSLPQYIGLVHEAMSLEALLDKSLVKQAVHSLAEGNSVEETIMYSFMLYVFTLADKSTGHPLEMGIIRQKIVGILPIFEKAKERGVIRDAVFESNESLLMSIADKTDDMPEALGLLRAGYSKYSE